MLLEENVDALCGFQYLFGLTECKSAGLFR